MPETTTSEPMRRAIVLVPGIKRDERFVRRDRLVDNLATVERHPLAVGGTVELAGEIGRRLLPGSLRGVEARPVETDVFEAYWGDMVEDPAETGPWGKLRSGFELVAFWVFSPGTWRAFALSRYVTIGLLSSGALLILWYVSIALLVATTLRGMEPPEVLTLPVLHQLYEGFLWIAAGIENFAYWALLAFILSAVNADGLAQASRFTKDYLENRPDEDEVGLRDRLRCRVRATLDAVLAEPYDEVVVAAHSLGSVIALDTLADWPHDADWPRLRFVTLGSPVAVLACRSSWLARERRKLLDRPPVTWLDFHSNADWLCTSVTAGLGGATAAGVQSFELPFDAGLLGRLNGSSHQDYYRDQKVLETLATPGLAPAPARA